MRGTFILFSFLAIFIPVIPVPGMTLVREGRPVGIIVTADDPMPSQKVAAEELQYHLRKMTGAVVPILAEKDLSRTGNSILRSRSMLRWQVD